MRANHFFFVAVHQKWLWNVPVSNLLGAHDAIDGRFEMRLSSKRWMFEDNTQQEVLT